MSMINLLFALTTLCAIIVATDADRRRRGALAKNDDYVRKLDEISLLMTLVGDIYLPLRATSVTSTVATSATGSFTLNFHFENERDLRLAEAEWTKRSLLKKQMLHLRQEAELRTNPDVEKASTPPNTKNA